VIPSRPWALFLDVDGTLLDISDTPGGVSVPAGLTATLETVRRGLQGALAFVSGRTIADLDRLFTPLRLPAAGQHGSEIRLSPDAPVVSLATAPIREALRRDVAAIAAAFPGAEMEDKGRTIAVHYRRAPGAADALTHGLRRIVQSNETPLILTHGRKVLELRDAGHSKATAVHEFMRHPRFEGRVPLFVGDDITDEDGFIAAEQYGGTALAVGTVHRPRRETAFAGPADVRAWLTHLSKTLAAGVEICPT
jgi:trehalose 6-phosphate phosphatase